MQALKYMWYQLNEWARFTISSEVEVKIAPSMKNGIAEKCMGEMNIEMHPRTKLFRSEGNPLG